MAVKYIFVTGGVVRARQGDYGGIAGLPKARASDHPEIDRISTSPGHHEPYQHGEVFVTDDGSKTDLDLGHYERFIDENLSENSNVTAGRLQLGHYQERRSDYPGARCRSYHISPMR